MKIITCAGFGGTGSSVITDYFREFSNIYSVGGNGFEFFLLHEPDGIKDLENALTEGHRFKVDFAIKRFRNLVNNLYYHNPSGPNYKNFFNGKFLEITNEYLKTLNIVIWKKGWWHRIFEGNDNKFYRFIKNLRFQKYVKSNYDLYEPDGWRPSYTDYSIEYYCNISRNEFRQKTKIYLNKLFSEIDTDAEYLLFDQLVPPSNSEEYLDYFDFIKVYIIDRDPRDLYFANKIFWGYGFIPLDSVDTFIEWYRNTRRTVKHSSRVCCLLFEDFIYKTKDTQNMVINFAGIDKKCHDKDRQYFFPERSIRNTQIFNRYSLKSKDMQNSLNSDINKIEIKLNEYLYPYESVVDKIQQKIEVNFYYEKAYQKIKQENNLISFIFALPFIVRYVCRKIFRKVSG